MKIFALTTVCLWAFTGVLQAEQDIYSILTRDGRGILLQRTNNQGTSIGAFSDQTGQYAVFFRNGQPELVRLPGDIGVSPLVTDINDNGEITGEVQFLSSPFTAGFVMKNGRVTTIQVPGEGRTTPLGLNNRGTIVGHYVPSTTSGQKLRAFLLRNGSIETFSYPGAIFSKLFDVNDSGVAVGEANMGFVDEPISFLYQNGAITQLPGVPGFQTTRYFSINNKGELTGEAHNDLQRMTGFVYRNGQFETFRIPGSTSFLPFGINDKGDVTGTYNGFDLEGTTFIRHAK